MARGKDNSKKRAEEQALKRRNSAAHRALRRRAQKGAGARSVDAGAAEPTGSGAEDAPRADGESPIVERTPTSELKTPAWLAAGEAATADNHEDSYVPRYEPEGVDDEADVDATASDAEPVAGVRPVVTFDETASVEPTDDAGSTDDAGPADSAEPTDEWPDGPLEPEGASDEWDERDGVPTPVRASVFAHDPEPEPEPGDDDSNDDATAVLSPVGDTTVMSPVDGEPVSGESASPAVVAPATSPFDEPSHADVVDGDDSDDDGHGGRPKRRRAAWIVPLTLAVIAVLYVGAQALLSNTVPRGTEVLGLEVGGMSTAEATGAVDDAAGAVEGEDVELRVAEQSFALPASDAGLSIDVDATVAQVTGFTLLPDRLWAHVAGGSEISPISAVDEAAMADALETASAQLDGPAQDAGVTMADGAVEVVPGRSSITVDQEQSADRLAQAWPSAQAIDLIAESEPPAITDEDAADFASELETETFAAPVTLVGEDAEATIEPATIAANSTVEPGASGLALVVDGVALAAQIIEDNPDLTTDGENASVSFNDSHDIVIEEGSPGITIDGEALGEAVLAAASSADRLGELPYTAADPEVSAEDLGLADFQEIVSSFDTPLTPEPVRTQNLRVAAADIQGVIVQPGDTFDLTEALSPINEEEGYQPAHVIVNGILTTGMGGGLSQMATTAYNAGYFAGFEILDHRPHSVWFTRYPAGRESTIYTGSINVEFRNNTPYAAVFNSYLSGGSVHVDIWSTKHFDVTTSASPKTNVQQPGVKEVTSANCEAKGPGQPGFTITNTRTVSLDGEVVDETSDTWTYKPDDAIRCVSEDEDDD